MFLLNDHAAASKVRLVQMIGLDGLERVLG